MHIYLDSLCLIYFFLYLIFLDIFSKEKERRGQERRREEKRRVERRREESFENTENIC
jgi:hypothetical protein